MTWTAPDYIYVPGSPLQHTPMRLYSSELYGFFVKGDLKKLQASVDATLNRVAAGRVTFKVLSPHVMLSFTRVGHAQSTFPADHDKGWGRETDIITWIAIGQMDEVGLARRLLFYPFHIWVDVATAIPIGREIFGYPKNICQCTMPAPGADPDQFGVRGEGWEPLSPETELGMHPLLEISVVNPGAHQVIAGLEELVHELVEFLKLAGSLIEVDGAGFLDLIGLLVRPRIDQVFLKQLPDGSGVKAVYQAVVVAPANVDHVRGIRRLGHAYRFTLSQFGSFPLDTTLGFALGAQEVDLAFNIDFDFTVGAAEELVVSAPSRSP